MTQGASPAVSDAVEAIVELIRKEIPGLLISGKNWKFVLSGSAGGDVRTAIETHSETVRRFVPVANN